jgi:hypothetical protein
MAHELMFTGPIENPNQVNVSFYVGPDGYVYVKQPNEEYELAPSRLETEDIRTLINFLQNQLPEPLN